MEDETNNTTTIVKLETALNLIRAYCSASKYSLTPEAVVAMVDSVLDPEIGEYGRDWRDPSEQNGWQGGM